MSDIGEDMLAKPTKKLAVEKIYQKKTQLEHILLRPDTYIGSVERLEQEMWVWNLETERMEKKNIKYVPGLFKIFDEIIVNASDNKIRDPSMTTIKIWLNKEDNMIKIYNNGKGIPIVEHKDEKVFVPTLIFGHLLTSSNYNDDEKKVTGGRNGYGAKLCNIFSKKFTVETSCKETKKYFKQTWTDNMNKAQDPVIKPNKDEDFTQITFYPDLKKFGMDNLEDDTIALLARRAYDIAASTRGVKVFLNDKRLPISKFEDYCKLYVVNNTGDEMSDSSTTKIIYESNNPRWEIAVSYSDIGFQQVSFVNSIATTKGGRHVDYICDQIIKHLTEIINKKNGKNSSQVKPFQIKNHLWVFINCLIENPVFESQTKESMSSQIKNFGSKCQLSEDFLKKVATRGGIVDKVLNWLAFKEKTDLEKTGAKTKQSKLKGIPKLDDANNAGTKDSINCTLILTEGDSAKTLAVAGLGVIGRDRYGVFPLRGKMLNVREATTKQILDNSEVTNLCKIIGLNFKEKYETRDSLKSLRYGKIMIMTDQDHDGSHIKGLIINFVHHQWPNLLKLGFVEEFITPIIKVFKSKKNSTETNDRSKELSFYSVPEFEEWQQNTPDWNTWKIKYYKGLGTSTSKEAKEYFSDMNRHCIKFEYSGSRDDLAIQLAFSKKLIDERKDWLTKFMEKRKTDLNQSYLYQKDTKKINFTQFVNKELVLFSNLDNERSIPSLVDGFKPGQRKVMFACFKRNLQKEIKVAQLAGSVAELSCYHHGEASLMSTIINLAQNFVGSNNLNLLLPIGQFGTRLHGGKDAASPRYIFTCLSPLTRLIFNIKDDPLLDYLNDDGQRVEPEYYVPILPTVLINGAEGIGTGWASKIPNYNVRDLINNLTRMIKKEQPYPMKPYYKNFKGHIGRLDDTHFIISGEIALIEDENDSKNDYTIEISELPIGTWTQVYKETVLEQYLTGPETAAKSNDTNGKTQQSSPLINDYKEYHTDCTVRFLVKMSKTQYQNAITQHGNLHKFFKLQKSMALTNMVLFDSNGCLKKYESPLEILSEFYPIRYKFYQKRKEYLENMLGAESCKLDNIARFILEKIEGKIKVENLKKIDLIKLLSDRGYQSDPVRKWKETITKEKGYLHDGTSAVQNNGDEAAGLENDNDNQTLDFNYLLSMPLWNLTLEKKEEIIRQQKSKAAELRDLQMKTVEQLWLDDLNEFKIEYEKMEQKEKEEMEQSFKKCITNKSGKNSSGPKSLKYEYLPAEDGERIEPKLDEQLIAKVEKEAQQKVLNKIKKDDAEQGLNIVDIITSDEKFDSEKLKEIDELAANIANPNKAKAKPTAPSQKKQPKIEDANVDDISFNDTVGIVGFNGELNETKSEKKKTSKSTKSNDPTKTTKVAAKKKEKITIDSGSEQSFDDEKMINEDFNEKRHVSGRAKKQIKYNFDDNSDEDDELFVHKYEKNGKSDNEDSSIEIKNGNKSSESDNDDNKEKKKPVPKKKPQPKKTTEPKETKKTKESKPPAPKKNPVKKLKDDDEEDDDEYSFNDDDDSDFEFGSKKKKAPKKTPTKAAKPKANGNNKKQAPKRKKAGSDGDDSESDLESKSSKSKKSKSKEIILDDDDDFSLD